MVVSLFHVPRVRSTKYNGRRSKQVNILCAPSYFSSSWRKDIIVNFISYVSFLNDLRDLFDSGLGEVEKVGKRLGKTKLYITYKFI